MPARTVPLVSGNYYHIYNRGHNRADFATRPQDYKLILHLFHRYLAAYHAKVVAYVIMPNHFHLLLQAKTDQLSRAMQRFSISLTKQMNQMYNRTGALFQGRFQSKWVDQDSYLLHLSRYIHLNPVNAGLVQKPEDWPYSSYREYVGLRRGSLPAPGEILAFFKPGDLCQQYKEFVEERQSEEQIAHLLLD